MILTHRNLIANALQCRDAFALAADDVLIAALPLFHIYGLSAIMNFGIRACATIVTMPRFELGQFLGLIERYRATRGYVVPPIALALARDPVGRPSRSQHTAPPHVRRRTAAA